VRDEVHFGSLVHAHTCTHAHKQMHTYQRYCHQGSKVNKLEPEGKMSSFQTRMAHSVHKCTCLKHTCKTRFRARKLELEGEVSKLQTDLASAKTQVAATTADNVALIERLRWVWVCACVGADLFAVGRACRTRTVATTADNVALIERLRWVCGCLLCGVFL